MVHISCAFICLKSGGAIKQCEHVCRDTGLAMEGQREFLTECAARQSAERSIGDRVVNRPSPHTSVRAEEILVMCLLREKPILLRECPFCFEFLLLYLVYRGARFGEMGTQVAIVDKLGVDSVLLSAKRGRRNNMRWDL